MTAIIIGEFKLGFSVPKPVCAPSIDTAKMTSLFINATIDLPSSKSGNYCVTHGQTQLPRPKAITINAVRQCWRLAIGSEQFRVHI